MSARAREVYLLCYLAAGVAGSLVLLYFAMRWSYPVGVRAALLLTALLHVALIPEVLPTRLPTRPRLLPARLVMPWWYGYVLGALGVSLLLPVAAVMVEDGDRPDWDGAFVLGFMGIGVIVLMSVQESRRYDEQAKFLIAGDERALIVLPVARGLLVLTDRRVALFDADRPLRPPVRRSAVWEAERGTASAALSQDGRRLSVTGGTESRTFRVAARRWRWRWLRRRRRKDAERLVAALRDSVG